MDCPGFLPTGSVIRIQGSDKTLLVISRAVVVPPNGKRSYYDYGCCLWPEGLMSDAVIYCNHDAVTEVLFRGFENEDERKMRETVIKAVKALDIPKGKPGPLGGKGTVRK